MSRGVIDKTLAKLVNDTIYRKQADWQGNVAAGKNGATITLDLPANADIISISLTANPNPNWIYASIGSYSNSSAYIGWNNTYSGTISGKFTVCVLYRLT
jgi:hypothetical protein